MKKNKEKESPRTVRGTATIHEDDRIEFKPYAEGEPAQLYVRTTTGAKTYETTSEKTPLKVAHLTCPANTADPYAEYVTQLERLGIKPHAPQQQPKKQRLVNEAGVEVYLDNKECVLTYQGEINLTKTSNWQSEVMRQLQVIVRTLPANTKFTKVLTTLKKKGSKK